MTAIEWRAIPGYEGMYTVSADGRVRSVPRIGIRGQRVNGRVLTPRVDRDGYLRVTMHRDGKQQSRLVHQLIAEAFLGPQQVGREIRHLNGNPADNNLANLAWGTHGENRLDQVRHGTDHNASKAYCDNRHEFTPENTYTRPGGHRDCRTCIRDRVRRYNRRQRELRTQGAAA